MELTFAEKVEKIIRKLRAFRKKLPVVVFLNLQMAEKYYDDYAIAEFVEGISKRGMPRFFYSRMDIYELEMIFFMLPPGSGKENKIFRLMKEKATTFNDMLSVAEIADKCFQDTETCLEMIMRASTVALTCADYVVLDELARAAGAENIAARATRFFANFNPEMEENGEEELKIAFIGAMNCCSPLAKTIAKRIFELGLTLPDLVFTRSEFRRPNPLHANNSHWIPFSKEPVHRN